MRPGLSNAGIAPGFPAGKSDTCVGAGTPSPATRVAALPPRALLGRLAAALETRDPLADQRRRLGVHRLPQDLRHADVGAGGLEAEDQDRFIGPAGDDVVLQAARAGARGHRPLADA